MKPSTEILIFVALGVSIAVGALYIASHVDLHCFNWFGLAKGCVTSVR